MTRSPTTDVDRLLAEAAAEPLSGWDFTRLAGRVVSDPLPWDYVALAAEAAGRAERVLDIDTGGGEVLATLGVPSGSVALEPYPPNLPVARARLLPNGIEVRARTDRRLPCDSSDFDLVLNRHGALDPAEIARVLRPGGAFWTQQVGADNDAELNTALGAPPVMGGLSSAADAAELLRAAGLRVLRADEAWPQTPLPRCGCGRAAPAGRQLAGPRLRCRTPSAPAAGDRPDHPYRRRLRRHRPPPAAARRPTGLRRLPG